MKEKTITTLLVTLHLLVVMVHGMAHQRLHIETSMWQRVFIAVVILIGPVLAMALLWARFRQIGFIVLLVTMAGSLLFGMAYHFFIPGSDNALELHSGHWESLFRTSARLLAVIEAAAVAWSVWALGGRDWASPSERRADRGWA